MVCLKCSICTWEECMLLQFDGAFCGFLISVVFFNSKFLLDFLLWFIFVCLTTLFSFVLSIFVFTSWNIVRSFSEFVWSFNRSFHDIPHPWPKRANSSWMLFYLCCWQPQFLGQLCTPAGMWVDVWGQEKTHQVLTIRLSLRAWEAFFLLSETQKFTVNMSSSEDIFYGLD